MPAVANPDFDRKYHTQVGQRLPMRPGDIDEVDTEALGKRLATQCRGWSMHDHQDAASSHMLEALTARGDAVGWSTYDAEPKLHLARQHIKMSQAHNIASGHVQKMRGAPKDAQGSIAKALRRKTQAQGTSSIGTTRSGKTVFAPGQGHQIGYTDDDHKDAARAHIEAARRLTRAKTAAKTANAVGRLRTKVCRHIDLAQAHLDAQGATMAPEAPTPPAMPKPIPTAALPMRRKQEASGGKPKLTVRSKVAHKALALSHPSVHSGLGAGSRGGVVIGRTVSGKAVYRHGSKTAAGFTAQDHAEAADVHANHALISDGETKRHHQHMARYHEFRATGKISKGWRIRGNGAVYHAETGEQ